MFNYPCHFNQGNTMKKFTSSTVASLLALTIGITSIGFAGGKEAKTATKDSKAACCAMDKASGSKDCTDADAASCPMMKTKASKEAKSTKGTKASMKTKKSAATTTATGGTN